MAITLPRFEDSFCKILSVCCRVTGDHAGLPPDSCDLAAAYKAAGEPALLHLIWEPNDHRHFHIDAALRHAFGDKPPKAHSRLGDVRKMLTTFEGVTVKAAIYAYFLVPLTSLPSTGGLIFTGSSAVRLRVKHSEVELTGAQLTFRHADIDRLRWDLVKDAVILDLYASREWTVGPSLLVDAMGIMESAVASYILGRTSDE